MQPVTISNTADSTHLRLCRRAVELASRYETIRYLATSNLKAGHRDKVLGHLWSLLDPLLFICVYFIVFGLLLGQTGRDRSTYIVYLSIGVLAFRFFESTIVQCTLCLRSNRGLIHEISFPKAVFPISVCLSRAYDLAWGMIVLIPIVLVTGIHLSLHMLWLVPLMMLSLLFACGLGFVAACMGAFFADTTNVANVAMRLLLYFSPTFYYARGEHSVISPRFQTIYMSNPIACFLESFRDALLWGRAPEPGLVAYAAVVAVVVFLGGFYLFTSKEGKFAKCV